MAGLALWSFSYAAELWLPGLPNKMWAIRFEFIGIVATPITIFLFCVENTGREGWLTLRNLAFLCIIPVVTIIVLWTNDFHHLFYIEYHLDTSMGFPNFVADHGIWFWVHTAYSYVILVFGFVL